MSSMHVSVGVGTRLVYDGEIVEITELLPSAAGTVVVVRYSRTQQVAQLAVKEIFGGTRVRILSTHRGPSPDDPLELPAVVLSNLTVAEQETVLERAAHLREMLTGYRSGHPETADVDEPRPPVMLLPALTSIGGAERLSRFAATTAYSTVTFAAAALGLNQPVLQGQIARLEAELGGPLFPRAQRGHPMTLTHLGTQALHAWIGRTSSTGGDETVDHHAV